MNFVNKILFKRQDFNKEEFEDKVSTQIHLLMQSGHVCVVQHLDENTIAIEYSPITHTTETPYPYFLLPDEMRNVSIYITKKAIELFRVESEELEDALEEIEEDAEFDFEYLKRRKKGGGHLH